MYYITHFNKLFYTNNVLISCGATLTGFTALYHLGKLHEKQQQFISEQHRSIKQLINL